MDSVKTLFLYYSNKFLNGEFDETLNSNFNSISNDYEEIKRLGEELCISLINSKNFNKSNIIQHHLSLYYPDKYNSKTEYILAAFDEKLSEYSKNSDLDSMRKLMKEYCDSLAIFTKHLRLVIRRADKEPKFYKLFAILGLSSKLYPLLVSLDIKGLLDTPLSAGSGQTYLDILEKMDIKIFKMFGENVARDQLAKIIYEAATGRPGLESKLVNYIANYDSAHIKSNLLKYAYNNTALVHILISYCEHLSGETYGIDYLKKLNRNGIAKEHILSQSPAFDPATFDFADDKEYKNIYLNSIGNITLLEAKLQSKTSNKTVSEKIKVYCESSFSMTKDLAGELSENNSFKKAEIQKRAENLIDFCVRCWEF
jgi:hypothetical protein